MNQQSDRILHQILKSKINKIIQDWTSQLTYGILGCLTNQNKEVFLVQIG